LQIDACAIGEMHQWKHAMGSCPQWPAVKGGIGSPGLRLFCP
jgi:hypothetical protein